MVHQAERHQQQHQDIQHSDNGNTLGYSPVHFVPQRTIFHQTDHDPLVFDRCRENLIAGATVIDLERFFVRIQDSFGKAIFILMPEIVGQVIKALARLVAMRNDKTLSIHNHPDIRLRPGTDTFTQSAQLYVQRNDTLHIGKALTQGNHLILAPVNRH